MWRVSENDLYAISIGAGILGTGGGGNPYLGQLRVREVLRRYGSVDVYDPDELDDSAQVVCVGGIGAPTVGVEKVRDFQAYAAFKAMEDYTGTRATHFISNEVGGSNSVEDMIPAAMSRLPVVDADGMGRAFPFFHQKTFFVYGVAPTPMALADDKGNIAVISEALSAQWVERLARAVTIQMGCTAVYAVHPMTADEVRRTAIPRSLSMARDLGFAVQSARARHSDPIAAILEEVPGTVLFQGKIVALERQTTSGFAKGSATLDGLGDYRGEGMVIEFQNENLIARRDGAVVCTTPDLICIVDTERGEPITTELLRYGFRVTVLGFPAPALWTTPEGLDVTGPRAFGYDIDRLPLRLNGVG